MRSRNPIALALVAALLIAAGASNKAEGARPPQADLARALSVTDTAHLREIKSSGALLIEEGPASGGFPGTVHAQFQVGPTVTSSFAIDTRNGSLIGRGTGVLHGTGVLASFAGTITISHGTGQYAHAHGHGGFYGVINRRTYALTVQTTGTLSF